MGDSRRQSQRTPTLVAVVAATAICVAAFALSFTALSDLAARSGITVPILWPAIVDGVVLAATVAVVAGASRFAWLLLVVGALVSVGGNVLHAALPEGALPVWLKAAVAAVPPVALLATAHLVVVLRNAPQDPAPVGLSDEGDRHEATPVAAALEPDAKGVHAVDTPGGAPQAEPVAVETLSRNDLGGATDGGDIKSRAMKMLAAGIPPRTVAEQIGVHRGTAYRWRNQIPAAELA
ncbi:excisionase [Rhodococcus hoagii]|nr:excisionase [Prescottella equi]NKS59878.1 excisionase [Prescottella equi]NKS70681.1 excisionase [Prescottella equi]